MTFSCHTNTKTKENIRQKASVYRFEKELQHRKLLDVDVADTTSCTHLVGKHFLIFLCKVTKRLLYYVKPFDFPQMQSLLELIGTM